MNETMIKNNVQVTLMVIKRDVIIDNKIYLIF